MLKILTPYGVLRLRSVRHPELLSKDGDTEKILNSCKEVKILSEFFHSKFTCLIIAVQISLPAYSGDCSVIARSLATEGGGRRSNLFKNEIASGFALAMTI